MIPVLGAAVLLTSCETTGKKKSTVSPPAKALAPAITQHARPEPKIEEQITRKPDPVEELIERVEKEYRAGQANYAAGHLEAAKENFDRAFNILLQGVPDVRSDDRLQDEFDKIVEGVHTLELLALKEGDGFTEQQSEPAPIDEANEVTFPVDPNIRAKAAEEVRTTVSDLPLVINEVVASYISYFSSRGRGSLEMGFRRGGRYRDMILKTLKEEGVPQDLYYLAQAESGFRPLALSRAGARGMWQFMASRGSGYGLRRNWWMDERQDPEKSTRAAARHLKDLYHQFGDWYLAMAAYNSGPGNVQRAVQRTGYADFWELYRRGVLPQETRNYVPIILAITIISKNPAQYGLENLQPEPPIQVDRVTIDYPVDLRLVAECVDSSVNTLQELNPSLLRMTTPKDMEFELRLPVGTKDKFQTAIASIPKEMRVWWRYHRVASGDTLASIAKRYRATKEAIARANDLDSEDGPLALAKLVIPVAPGRRAEGEGLAFSKTATRYKVRRGDTVLSVADDFGVPADKLRKWNGIRGNSLRAGRVVKIYRPAADAGDDEPRKVVSKGREAKGKSTATAGRGTKGKTVRSAASHKKSNQRASATKPRQSKKKSTAQQAKRKTAG